MIRRPPRSALFPCTTLLRSLVYCDYHSEMLFFWLGAVLFVAGSILDILDGALARFSGKATSFGAFVDSTTDRISEAFMLGAIALVLLRDGSELGIGLVMAAVAGSFLVSYTRAGAEGPGVRGDGGIGSRAERVVVIPAGLVRSEEPTSELQSRQYLVCRLLL